jgi:Protein of unknown function (DUF3313)
MKFHRIIIAFFALSIIAGCSSAPKVAHTQFLSDYEKLSSHKEKKHYSDSRFVDKPAVENAKSLGLARTSYSDVVLPEGITQNQMNIIANNIDRELCVGFSSYFEIVDEEQTADLNVRSNLTAIRATGKGMATVSAIAGNIAPVWIRPPTGMGALAAEAELLDNTKQQRAAIVWTRSARSLNESESISSIGDAYQLADTFASDFIKLVVGKRKKMKDAKELKDKNRDKCVARYGKTKLLGTAAGLLLPMSPESKDTGRPVNQTPADTATTEKSAATLAEDSTLATTSASITEATDPVENEKEKEKKEDE